jgi:alpha-N-arabinofuranosidase
MAFVCLAAVSCDGERPSDSTSSARDECPRNTSAVTRRLPPVAATDGSRGGAAIRVDSSTRLGRISPLLYGINHRYAYAGFGMWDSAGNRPAPRFVDNFRYSGFTAVRFPGGRMANTYRWKRAIGPPSTRHRQVNGGGMGQPLTSEFGPDEFGHLIDGVGAEGTVVVNFATADADEAADFVEYMNAPEGTNPRGGRAWADVRARNGHPEPYGIKYWEVGNEMNSDKVYWIGDDTPDPETAVKYAFGGETHFQRQTVGKLDDHRPKAALSDGEPSQVFYVKYPPVRVGSTVFVDGEAWNRVDDLDSSGRENAYELDRGTGRILFGDGDRGNIPPEGAVIDATYVSGPHDGFVDYYREMKSVDPSIRIGSAIHNRYFVEAMGAEQPYDFIVVHSYGYFYEDFGPNDLHDYVMRLAEGQRRLLEAGRQELIRHAGPERAEQVGLFISEYGMGSGNNRGINAFDAPKHYMLSLDNAIYTALQLKEWIELGVEVAERHSLIDSDPQDPPPGYGRVNSADAAVIGPTPCFVSSASARTFRVFTEMMGDTRLKSRVVNNHVRTLPNGDGLPALVTIAGTDESGDVYLIVINRDRASDVRARVETTPFAPRGDVLVWTLDGPSHLSYNTVAHPNVVAISERIVQGVEGSFDHVFPAHSITAFRMKG